MKKSRNYVCFGLSNQYSGIFAIGDVNTYPGKIKVDSLWFPRSNINVSGSIPNYQSRYMYFKYTTVSQVDGFDGTRKEAPKAVVKAIV
jgi:thioredoxin reductase (NADPH)